MSVVWDGKPIQIPCLNTRSFLDDVRPKVPRSQNCYTNDHSSPGSYNRAMVQPITGLVWHTVHGTANGTILTDGTCGTVDEAYAYARDFARASREASTTFIVADNGVVLNLIDIVRDRGWGSGQWNAYTINTEIDQHRAGGICKAAIDSAVQLAWWLSEAFGVQAMIPVNDKGEPDLDDLPRLLEEPRTFRGSWFHANQGVRGRGDPGPAFGRAFLASGAEGFNIRKNQDRDVWIKRQVQLGLPAADQDGIPGEKTVAAIERKFGRRTWATQRGGSCLSSKSGARASGGGGGAGLLMLGAAGLAAWFLMGRGQK